jgi:hypothetical protein
MQIRFHLSVLILLAPLVQSCSDPLEVEDLLPFDPPRVYRVWWAEVEQCVGLKGDFDQIRWFTAEAMRVDGENAFGVWSPPSTIYLERFYTTSAPAVKHEMLHDLTGGAMPHSHPVFATCTTARLIESVDIGMRRLP